MMRDAGCRTFVEDPASATVGEAPANAVALGAAEKTLPIGELGDAVIATCNQAG